MARISRMGSPGGIVRALFAVRVTRFVLALQLCLPGGSYAQQVVPRLRGSVFESQAEERWLHGSQRARYTAFDHAEDVVRIDSVSSGPVQSERQFALSLGPVRRRGEPAILVVGPGGTLERAEVRLREPSIPNVGPEEIAVIKRWRLFRTPSSHRLAMPESRLWDLVPTWHPGRVERGARWVDTLRLVAERGEFVQTLDGVRTSTILRDTLVDGRRLWVVHDSAAVRYREQWQRDERTLDTLVTGERRATGTIRGVYLFDPSLGLYRVRADTTALMGAAELRYPDGRTFDTPARYDRTRQITLYDPAGYRVLVAKRRAAARARPGGMVSLPHTALEQRLAGGDSGLRDSLLAVWAGSDDPAERDRLYGLVNRWWSRESPAYRDTLRSVLLEGGDTVAVASAFRNFGSRPLDAGSWFLIAPFLEDPGRAWAFDLDSDPLYENVRRDLLWTPPAIVPDTAGWPCPPDVCRRLAGQWTTAREPRLRDLGLIAHLVLEPARWADTVLARARVDSAFLEPAVSLIHGVGATWSNASKRPIPAPEDGWRAWGAWMNGWSPPRDDAEWSGKIRLEQSHRTALRFYEALTGRPLVSELERKMQVAQQDSARLLYGTMLLSLGAYRPDPDSVARQLQSGSAVERELAANSLPHLFHAARPADSATAAELTDTLLAIVIDGADPWPLLQTSERRLPWGAGVPRRPADSTQVFILSDHLSAGVRAHWRERAHVVSEEAWMARDPRRPAVLFRPGQVVRIGPFVHLQVSATRASAQTAEQGTRAYAAGIDLTLMETERGWVVVRRGAWIT